MGCYGVRLAWVPVRTLPSQAMGHGTLAPQAQLGGCTVYYNKAVGWSWRKLCSVTVHEYGHLIGYGHSRNSDSIMYPSYLGSNWWPCSPACDFTWAQRKAMTPERPLSLTGAATPGALPPVDRLDDPTRGKGTDRHEEGHRVIAIAGLALAACAIGAFVSGQSTRMADDEVDAKVAAAVQVAGNEALPKLAAAVRREDARSDHAQAIAIERAKRP